MNEKSDQDPQPGKGWLSSLLFAFGILALLGGVVAFLIGGPGFLAWLGGLAIAIIFFALSKALDQLHEIVQRLRRIEDRLNGGNQK